MGSKHSTGKTPPTSGEKTIQDDSSTLEEHNILLFPNFGASTFVRQIANKVNDANEVDFCCTKLLTEIRERFKEVCLNEDLQTNAGGAREALSQIWNNYEMRQIILEKYLDFSKLVNIPIFMNHLLSANFDNGLENSLNYIVNRTSGVLINNVIYSNSEREIQYKLYEIGGSRSEWKKAFVVLDHVEYVIYFFGLSDILDCDLEHVLHKYSYSGVSKPMKENPKCRFILIFTKPDVLQRKLSTGMVYEGDGASYEMREELKLISNDKERKVINLIVNKFLSQHMTEYHIVNLLCKEEVHKLKDIIFSGSSSFPFISNCLREKSWRLESWKLATNKKYTDIEFLYI